MEEVVGDQRRRSHGDEIAVAVVDDLDRRVQGGDGGLDVLSGGIGADRLAEPDRDFAFDADLDVVLRLDPCRRDESPRGEHGAGAGAGHIQQLLHCRRGGADLPADELAAASLGQPLAHQAGDGIALLGI